MADAFAFLIHRTFLFVPALEQLQFLHAFLETDSTAFFADLPNFLENLFARAGANF